MRSLLIKNDHLFYGWIIVVLAFISQAFGLGSQYTTGLFIEHFSTKFQATHATVLFSTSGVMIMATGLGSTIFGLLLQRYSIRSLLIVGLTAASLGYVGIVVATTLWQILIIYGLLFSSAALISGIAGNTLVSNWFIVHRGRALGIAASGIFTAGFTIVPLTTYLFDQIGVDKTCLILAALIFSSVPLIHFFAIDKPDEVGLLPDGYAYDLRKDSTGDFSNNSWTTRKLLSSTCFWLCALISGGCVAAISVILTNLFLIAQSHGLARLEAASLISITAGTALVGVIGLGRLFDVLSQRRLAQLTGLLLLSACFLFALSNQYSILILGAMLLGLGAAATQLMPSILSGKNFGQKGFAIAIGVIGTISVCICVAVLTLFGFMFDRFGDYRYAIGLIVVLLTIVIGLASMLPRRSIENTESLQPS